jgi:two-component system, OmpR family, response regulator VicR
VEREQPTILVVEDEPIIVELLTVVLDDAGYRVLSARDGEEALLRLAQERPGLILCDIMMPRMDGVQFYRAIQAKPAWRAIPFIFMSAVRSRLPQEGNEAVMFIPKPFDLDHLLELVAERLDV